MAKCSGYIFNILDEVPDLNPVDLLVLVKRELPCNGSPKAKEESLAGIGQLIVILTILTTRYCQPPSTELLKMIYPILIANLKGREYLISMCSEIMADSFTNVSIEMNNPLTVLSIKPLYLFLFR